MEHHNCEKLFLIAVFKCENRRNYIGLVVIDVKVAIFRR